MIQVSEGSVARPGPIAKVRLFGNVLEPAASQIPVEDTVLGPVRIKVAVERIRQGEVIAATAPLVGRVNPDVGQEQIQQPVIVEVKEHCAR